MTVGMGSFQRSATGTAFVRSATGTARGTRGVPVGNCGICQSWFDVIKFICVKTHFDDMIIFSFPIGSGLPYPYNPIPDFDIAGPAAFQGRTFCGYGGVAALNAANFEIQVEHHPKNTRHGDGFDPTLITTSGWVIRHIWDIPTGQATAYFYKPDAIDGVCDSPVGLYSLLWPLDQSGFVYLGFGSKSEVSDITGGGSEECKSPPPPPPPDDRFCNEVCEAFLKLEGWAGTLRYSDANGLIGSINLASLNGLHPLARSTGLGVIGYAGFSQFGVPTFVALFAKGEALSDQFGQFITPFPPQQGGPFGGPGMVVGDHPDPPCPELPDLPVFRDDPRVAFDSRRCFGSATNLFATAAGYQKVELTQLAIDPDTNEAILQVGYEMQYPIYENYSERFRDMIQNIGAITGNTGVRRFPLSNLNPEACIDVTPDIRAWNREAFSDASEISGADWSQNLFPVNLAGVTVSGTPTFGSASITLKLGGLIQ